MTSVVCSDLLLVDVQNAIAETSDGELDSESEEPPSSEALRDWARVAYAAVRERPAELTIRLSSTAEITQLNHDYRGKDQPTNVLSFPFELEIDLPPEMLADDDVPALLGDIVVCHSVILDEAAQQGKSPYDHYAHMVTHGVLHLCGYDHQDEKTATEMETLEVSILSQSNISNPYN